MLLYNNFICQFLDIMYLSIKSLNIVVLVYLTGVREIGAQGSPQLYDNQDLIDAGCKYDSCGPLCESRKWIGYGTTLQKGACVAREYSKGVPPEIEGTKVYCTILGQMIREIDTKKRH